MKIITWINNAITQDIGFQSLKFLTTEAACDFLADLYMHDYYAKEYQLQGQIRAIHQGDSSM